MRYEIPRWSEETKRYKVLEIDGPFLRVKDGIKGDRTSVREIVIKLEGKELLALAKIFEVNGLEEIKKEMEKKLKKQQKKQQETPISVASQNLAKVKIKLDIPEFIGTDGQVYGPFQKGQIVEINSEEASFLVEKNMAEFVDSRSRT